MPRPMAFVPLFSPMANAREVKAVVHGSLLTEQAPLHLSYRIGIIVFLSVTGIIVKV